MPFLIGKSHVCSLNIESARNLQPGKSAVNRTYISIEKDKKAHLDYASYKFLRTKKTKYALWDLKLFSNRVL